MGIFAICIPFKEVVCTGWPRLATGALGLILWIYGLSYILSQGRRKAHGPGVEAAPTPPPIGPS